jgi:hypothetical protein
MRIEDLIKNFLDDKQSKSNTEDVCPKGDCECMECKINKLLDAEFKNFEMAPDFEILRQILNTIVPQDVLKSADFMAFNLKQLNDVEIELLELIQRYRASIAVVKVLNGEKLKGGKS